MIFHRHVASPVEATIPFQLAHNQQILLMPVGDVHFLSKQWPQENFIEHLKWGMDRGAMFLGMGEYLDVLSASQREMMLPLRDTVKKEFNEMVKAAAERFVEMVLFSRGRWVGMLEGDHRWTFEDGTTVDQMLCDYLGCPFLGDATLIRLGYKQISSKHPEADCVIYAHHGFGSSRLAGGHLHRVEDLLKFIDADIYLMGHSHSKVSAPIDRQYISSDGIQYHRTKLLARTGSWMKSYTSGPPLDLREPAFESRASYAEKAVFMPSAMGGLAIGIGYEQIAGSKYYRPTIHHSV